MDAWKKHPFCRKSHVHKIPRLRGGGGYFGVGGGSADFIFVGARIFLIDSSDNSIASDSAITIARFCPSKSWGLFGPKAMEISRADGESCIRSTPSECTPQSLPKGRTKKNVPVNRVSFWRGVLRDYLLRSRWMLQFLGNKRKKETSKKSLLRPPSRRTLCGQGQFFFLS